MSDEIKDMALEDTDEEKAKAKIEAEKAVTDMSLDDSIPKDLEARISKAFPDEQYIYMTAADVISKSADGKYTLRRIPIADLTDDWKKKVDEFLKKENK